MKKEFIMATAVLALSANAGTSETNRTGPGSPGVYQTPPPRTSSDTITSAPRPSTSAPTHGSLPGNPAPGIAVGRGTLSTPAQTNLVNSPQIGRAAPNAVLNSDGQATPRVGAFNGETSKAGAFNPTHSIEAAGSTTPRGSSELNTTGISAAPTIQEQPLDRALSAKIRSQLNANPGAGQLPVPTEAVRDMRIISQKGTVVLDGTVDSETERRIIESRAYSVPGVDWVENRLTIRNKAVGAPASSQTGRDQLTPTVETREFAK